MVFPGLAIVSGAAAVLSLSPIPQPANPPPDQADPGAAIARIEMRLEPGGEVVNSSVAFWISPDLAATTGHTLLPWTPGGSFSLRMTDGSAHAFAERWCGRREDLRTGPHRTGRPRRAGSDPGHHGFSRAPFPA